MNAMHMQICMGCDDDSLTLPGILRTSTGTCIVCTMHDARTWYTVQSGSLASNYTIALVARVARSDHLIG